MKQLLIIIALLPVLSFAQPVITSSIYPLDGTTLELIDCGAPDPQADNNGANVMWDFSDLTNCDIESWSLNFNNIEGSTFQDSFPEANKYIDILVETNTLSRFYNVDDASWKYIGINHFAFNELIKAASGEAEHLLEFPTNYEDVWTHNYQYTLGDDTISGESTFTVDGFGTLILPNGTFENVLRVHSSRTAPVIFTEETYTYYSSEYQYYLLHILVGDESQYQINPTTSNYDLPILENLRISPNPASSFMPLKIELATQKKANIYVSLSTGQRIISKKGIQFSGGTYYLTPETALKKGVYIIQIQVDDKIYTSKLIIQ